MSDPNMAEFYKRAARLELARAKGMGFEATGTLGRSYYNRSTVRRRSILWPALFLLIAGFVLKAAILYHAGADLYGERVAALQASEGMVERAGGYLMQTDPVTIWLSEAIAIGVMKAKS